VPSRIEGRDSKIFAAVDVAERAVTGDRGESTIAGKAAAALECDLS
jgi:hypothetical protein